MSASILVMIMMADMICGSHAAGIVFSTTPQSRNVSAGTMVEFTCAAPATGLTTFSISTTPTVGGSVVDGSDLPNGDRLITLNFIAPSDQTSISIACAAITTTGFNQSFAVLMIQGVLSPVSNLISTEVENCTLHFTWIAPSSLEGVPINYIINITDTNGMMLMTDTTNTTEYLYSVSSLGETLEIEVTATNGAGTGNATSIMTRTPSSIRYLKLMNTSRTNSIANTNWTYTFDFEETSVCGNAISHVTVEACLDSSCTSTNGTVSMLPDGERRVMATFTGLMKNEIYTATLNIHYHGGVVQQSQLAENLSTFDVCNANVTKMKNGRVCLSIEYVEGHIEPASSYILFNCSTTRKEHNGVIHNTSGCIDVDPHSSYTIIATDNDTDAVKKINVVAPVTIPGVSVPDFTSIAPPTQNTVSSSNTATTGLPSSNSDTIIVAVAVPIIVLVLVVGLLLAAVITGILCYKMNMKRDTKIRHVTTVEFDVFQPPESQRSDDNHSEHENCQLSKNQQSDDNHHNEVIYSHPDIVTKGAPLAPLPTETVEYSKSMISAGQKQSLERLEMMNNSQLLKYFDLFHLLQPLAFVWKEIGEALYLAPYLEEIEKHHSDDERLKAVLVYWKDENMRQYTWEILDDVLRFSKIGATDLANKLKIQSVRNICEL